MRKASYVTFQIEFRLQQSVHLISLIPLFISFIEFPLEFQHYY